jgi:repressor LexA
VPLVGVIAAGRPFESYADGFLDGFEGQSPDPGAEIAEPQGEDRRPGTVRGLPIDARLFAESGDLLALRVEGDSMVNAGILHGDYAIIRRQNTVEEGDIAAVIINGEGTLKRWHVRSRKANGEDAAADKKIIQLAPANERFDPIEITEEDAKDILVFGKYVGLVRGNLQLF